MLITKEDYCPLIKNTCRDDCVFRFAEYCHIVSAFLDLGVIATALENKHKQPHYEIVKDYEK